MTGIKDSTLNKFAFSAGGSLILKACPSVLSVESAEDQVSFMSDFNITRDAVGLALARDLLSILLGAIQTLEADQKSGTLPPVLALRAAMAKGNPLQ